MLAALARKASKYSQAYGWPIGLSGDDARQLMELRETETSAGHTRAERLSRLVEDAAAVGDATAPIGMTERDMLELRMLQALYATADKAATSTTPPSRVQVQVSTAAAWEDQKQDDTRNAMLQDALTYIDQLEEVVRQHLKQQRTKASTVEAVPSNTDSMQIRRAIEQAVADAYSCEPEARRKRIKALRLKWHPDKHQVLRGLAEEVTKLINEAIQIHEESSN